MDKWTNLNKKIKEMYNKNHLLVSNNKADHKYLNKIEFRLIYITFFVLIYKFKYNCKKSEFF